MGVLINFVGWEFSKFGEKIYETDANISYTMGALLHKFTFFGQPFLQSELASKSSSNNSAQNY